MMAHNTLQVFLGPRTAGRRRHRGTRKSVIWNRSSLEHCLLLYWWERKFATTEPVTDVWQTVTSPFVKLRLSWESDMDWPSNPSVLGRNQERVDELIIMN
jgi:hypothetical protein